MLDAQRAQTCGILGGGQLGCLLADAALSLGLKPLIYAEAESPAAALFGPAIWHAGRVTEADFAQLERFLGRTAVVVFENEFVDCDLLERAATGKSVRFAPSLQTLRTLQDKLTQKERLASLGIPTAEFIPIRPPTLDIAKAVEQAYDQLKGQVVFKWSRMGYDGKGVHLAKSDRAGREAATAFCSEALARGVAVYAERRIDFRRELAIVCCQPKDPAPLIAYPLVVSEQERGVCRRVMGPATSPELETQAREAAQKLAISVGLEGAFALELFEDAQGGLLVNEIAPRVHNTGHYSLDACPASQFENHWRSVLGLPAGDTRPKAPVFGMLNLLGPEGVTVELERTRQPQELPAPQVPLVLHWYGKAQVKPWRKVGHVNGTGKDAASLRSQLDDYHSRWIQALSGLQPIKRNP